jgi:hypothetical protein
MAPRQIARQVHQACNNSECIGKHGPILCRGQPGHLRDEYVREHGNHPMQRHVDYPSGGIVITSR